ncbi:sensor histidine kinase [Streptomyces sulfonofaciens]|uniref:sensor histidine kinase n=1 Tax=Streptomyces sulfonofaciens TaxID=68272 RepID=UPI001E414963|nr:HAMP domain-containing sensor histidine kinase [Streptomyces sulfonofaciens]
MRRRSLRTRLVVAAVTLIAVVCAVIGTVTTIALRSHLYEQLDGQLGELGMRATGPRVFASRSERPPGPPPGAELPRRDPLDFVSKGPQELGTVGAVLDGHGAIARAVVSEERRADRSSGQAHAAPLTDAQAAALGTVAEDGRPHTVDVPVLGEYRVAAVSGERGSFLVGLPTDRVTNTLQTLIAVEVSVTGAGLIAASLAGAAAVGMALRPLRRVAATATRVSELPLHRGEVALHERVPDAEADPATEVGQVGAALNRMLDHVHEALDARQRSETRVRRFVADASHELRTPLASIRGYAELTRRGSEEAGPDTRHALRRIESEARRMSGLVEDLLLLARLDAGRPLSSESTDLSPIVVDALSDARAAGAGHAWRLDLPDEPMLVTGDPARLHQVLLNLLANARTHTPPGTTVTARVQREGPWVRLDVEDDGPGIPPALLPHVFERFARGDASRARAGGGAGADGAVPAATVVPGTSGASGGSAAPGATGSTGLGLAIVQAVTTAHGGTVGARSVPGRTVFTVHLPAVTDPGAPAAETPLAVDVPRAAETPRVVDVPVVAETPRVVDVPPAVDLPPAAETPSAVDPPRAAPAAPPGPAPGA